MSPRFIFVRYLPVSILLFPRLLTIECRRAGLSPAGPQPLHSFSLSPSTRVICKIVVYKPPLLAWSKAGNRAPLYPSPSVCVLSSSPNHLMANRVAMPLFVSLISLSLSCYTHTRYKMIHVPPAEGKSAVAVLTPVMISSHSFGSVTWPLFPFSSSSELTSVD
jgi:hypothetical protein